MKKTCRAFIVRCMHFHLWDPVDQWARENNLVGKCDLISLGGVLKDMLSSDRTVRNYLFRQIDIAYNLHDAREGFILDHMECEAWGGIGAFKTAEQDFNFHARILRDVSDIIKAEYPDLLLHLIVIKMEQGRAIEFVEIAPQ